MKRYISELIGTMVLVLFGCGSAAIAGSVLGTFGIAMAFGLSIVAMAYVIGDISGCHVNPAVSIGMWIDGRLETKDLLVYIVFQFIGAIIGIALLVMIINSAPSLGGYAATGLGQNEFGSASSVGLDVVGAILVEIILTFVFVFTVLGVTKKAENAADHSVGTCRAPSDYSDPVRNHLTSLCFIEGCFIRLTVHLAAVSRTKKEAFICVSSLFCSFH